jgi:hypothetical protein
MKYLYILLTLATILLLAATPGMAQSCRDDILASTPDNRFVINSNDTVTDTVTALVWKRCSEGQIWDGTSCAGDAAVFTWQEALQQAESSTFAGQSDWRLPNSKELSSIYEQRCLDPAINLNAFPNNPAEYFWSSSPDAGVPDTAWVFNFGWGDVGGANFNDTYCIRLVRGGQ